RVKISFTNLRLETTVPQKEEIFQVVIDIIKNSTSFKAFTISVNVPKIFMQQFWYTIKKVQGTDSYEFFLANKKCRVDAEVFRKILDICPRVKGEEFTELQNDDDTLTFLRDLSYKGPLHNQAVRVLPDVHQETVDVSKESEPEPEPEPIKRKAASRRVIKKKVTISTDDNVILDIDIALELDEINKYKIHVRKDEDEEMLNSEVEDSGKGYAEVSDVAKADAEKTKETKDDFKKAELPPISSSLSISSGFGDQFLKLSSDTSLVAPVTTLPLLSVSTIPHAPQQTTTPIPPPLITTNAPIITFVVLEFDALFVVYLRVAKWEKDIPIEKSALEILNIKKEQAEKQKMPKYTIKSTNKHHDDDDKDPLARPNKGKKTKTKRTKESESSKKPSSTKETPKGKALSKGSKTGKSAFKKEPVEESIAKVVMDNAGEDVVRNDDQPQDISEPKISKIPNQDWFKQPPRPPTPYLEWNMHKLDWNNSEGDRYPFDLSKPLPLQARYEIEAIEDMVPMLWSPAKFRVIYEDLVKQKQVIRADELYKFSDETLKKVRDELHHRVLHFDLGYNNEMLRRKWTATEKKRSELMVELIDK
nr:hypothetical protein [Tanacetum cinerariifolium]